MVALTVLLISGQAGAQSDQGRLTRVFGQGHPQSIESLPAGKLRNRLQSLPPQASSRALRRLQEFSFPEADLDSLEVDDQGNVLYADSLLPDAEQIEAAENAEGATDGAPAVTLDDAFLLHSRPGASNVVFIDFDGATITGTWWNGNVSQYDALPYNVEGDASTFSTLERTRIVDIWHRVAEDLAPYDIDVTTEEPAVFNSTTGHILVTHTVDANGVDMPYNGGGGVAYVNVFGNSDYHTKASPALVYYDHLGSGGETFVAEASSHEFGHNLGLSHDGDTNASGSAATYYGGHGSGLVSWAPIMGNSYSKNVTEWSKGEYTGANQFQDDLAIIALELGYLPDDHGNTQGAASTLSVDAVGSVVSSNPELDPHNLLPGNKGVIGSDTDVDVFSFSAGAGNVDLTISPAWDAFYRSADRRGANLDVRAELRDPGGAQIAISDPNDDTGATINATVSGGTYYLHISGAGNTATPYSDYDSLGQYFINGSVPSNSVVFAAIGDYGDGSAAEQRVASLIDGWGVDFIIGAGDNRYGSISYDTAVGQDYCAYMSNVGSGTHCSGGTSGENAFFPVPGNHDYYDGGGINEYLGYFDLPGAGIETSGTSGSERFYDFVQGPVHFFGIDSDQALNSGTDMAAQQSWLQQQLAESTALWQVVFLHHAPYSSASHGSYPALQWPFAAWGVDAVFAGHDHVYERLETNGIPFFVNGLGGRSIYGFNTPLPNSQVRYNSDYGAMRIAANGGEMTFEFLNTSGTVIDTHTIGEPVVADGVIDRQISNGNDDVEEELLSGTVYFASSDIELGDDPAFNGSQTVGLRFLNLDIPQGANIDAATLQFVVDETGSGATDVEIGAHAIDNAPAFANSTGDVTSRPLTANTVLWSIPAWGSVGAVKQSPDISSVVQEVVDRPGWAANNSIAVIIGGSGTRTAESFEGSAGLAPLLHVEYSLGTPSNAAPTAAFTASSTDLTATFTDTSSDSDGSIAAWAWDFGDASGSSAQNPEHTYTASGTYMVMLTVTDNDGATDSASQSVTVTAAPDSEPPSVPAVLQIDAVTASRIDISWSGSTDNVEVTGYEVFRDGVSWTSVAGTGYSDTGLAPATTHEYQVRAYDEAGNQSDLTSSVFGTTDGIPPDVITLIDAVYKADRGEFKVRATSSEQPDVMLEVVGFGPMRFKNGKYEYKLKPVGSVTIPSTVDIVSSRGALLTVPVVGAPPPPVPGQAGSPSPANGQADVSTGTLLDWSAGANSDTHEVYFGTSSNPPFAGSQAATGFDPGTLANTTTYYWRIDEVNAFGTTTGATWSFTTAAAPQPPGPASSPSPADGGSNVDVNVNLGWSAGSQADSHNVYFGTTASPPQVSSGQTGTSHDPGELSELTTYYWRVDEVNALGTTVGTTWSFTTRDAAPADTIVITKAEWKASRKELKVEGTSTGAPGAVLTVEGFGQMTYDAGKNKYKFALRPVNSSPGTVTVTSSQGGSASKEVRLR
jgi:PKD repeat protein